VIEVSTLVKRYGRFEAVRGISFEVGAGEVLGFLGPNGAGKTTTMRMIAGLIRPTSGRIVIDGHDLAQEPLAAKAVTSFIPDRPFLYEKLTGFELLQLVAGLYRLERQPAARRSGELLETFGLADWADTLIESYSHGMKQRLVFAAALLPRPRLLVVDEPMVGLDPRGARLVKQVLRDLCADRSLAVFLSTHTLDVAEEVCDRIAIIHRGALVACGSMDDLRREADRPGSRLEEVFLQLTDEGQRPTPGDPAPGDPAPGNRAGA
jgi:ABC-2 type transport system ATP-binding protein